MQKTAAALLALALATAGASHAADKRTPAPNLGTMGSDQGTKGCFGFLSPPAY